MPLILHPHRHCKVEEPYFNEPGYERQRVELESRAYNTALQFHTLRVAMQAYFQRPDPYFQGLIMAHFGGKRDVIRRQILVRLRCLLLEGNLFFS